MKLTVAERALMSQIINIKLDNATLKDHIMLEGIYKAVKADNIEFPMPPDFVDEEDKQIFKDYDGMKIDEIENEEHKQKVQEAVKKSREEQNKIWANRGGNEIEVNLSEAQVAIMRDFFEQDKRTWPRDYHKAILDLHEKISG